jgi:hypothetical protein
MTAGPEINGGLSPEEQRVAERLRADKPVPAAGFRGGLGRYLAARDPGYGPRPENLRMIACGCLAASVGMLALGALQATGAL